MIKVYYDKSRRIWVAYYSDSIGQLGDCATDTTRDRAAFKLGFEFGANPQKFTRPVGQYFEQKAA
jgi:hypothetical protein